MIFLLAVPCAVKPALTDQAKVEGKMYIHEYGDPAAPKLLCLHPLLITGDDLYQAVIPYLRGSYCIIAPDQGGHGQSGPYHSLREEVDYLRQYLLDEGNPEIQLLYGASMGVSAAYELWKDSSLHIRKAWLDSGGFAESSLHFTGPVAALTRAVLRIFRQNPQRRVKTLSGSYGPEFAEIMMKNFMKSDDDDTLRILEDFGHRDIGEMPAEKQKRMHLEWGSKDTNYRQSVKIVSSCLPEAEITVREGCGHCGYMAFHTAEYVQELEEFIAK